jgi:hypothetical protein
MSRLKLLVGSLVAFLVVWTIPGFSQTSSTSVRGTVTDPSASVVQGATVVLTNAESKTARAATTGEQGEYQFLFVAPGTYTLTVTRAGFSRYEQTGLRLLVNTPATSNIQLKVGAMTESVTVTSEAPAIDMVDASIGNAFDQTQVRQIPLEGRTSPTSSACKPVWPIRAIVQIFQIPRLRIRTHATEL